jgi:predicted flap endonuclease-1-like 5' DNA nuclease
MFHQNVTLGPGTGTFSQHTFEIFIMLLGATLLGLWLGWILWNRYKEEAEKLRLELLAANTTVEALRKEITEVKTKWTALEADHQNLSAQVVSLSRNNTHQRDRIADLEDQMAQLEARNRQLETELGLSYEPEDTDTYEVAAANETPDYHLLGETAAQKGDEPLTVAPVPNIPLEIHVPESSSVVVVTSNDTPVHVVSNTEESPSASVNNPLDLVSVDNDSEENAVREGLKEQIYTGLTNPVEVAEVEEVYEAEALQEEEADRQEDASGVIYASNQKDDLTVIEGIGPKIQELLYQYGIRTYSQLAATDVTKVKEILRSAGPQLAMHDPGTWTAQALLAANDQWENLKAYQDYLSSGKSPKAKG